MSVSLDAESGRVRLICFDEWRSQALSRDHSAPTQLLTGRHAKPGIGWVHILLSVAFGITDGSSYASEH